MNNMMGRPMYRCIKPHQIEPYVLEVYGDLNPLQQQVLERLVSQATEIKMIHTREALEYVFGEICEDNKILERYPSVSQVLDMFSQFYSNLLTHQREHKVLSGTKVDCISKAVIVRTKRQYGCPGPWC